MAVVYHYGLGGCGDFDGDHAGVQGTGGVPDYFGRVGGGVVSGAGYVALMEWAGCAESNANDLVVRFFPFSNRELVSKSGVEPIRRQARADRR